MSALSTPAVRATGLALVAIGIAHRMAFFSWQGLALTVGGFALLAAGGFPSREVEGRSMAYPALLVALCLVAALAPFDPGGINLPEAAATAGAGVVFYILGASPRSRPFRLPAAGALLVAAHAHFLLRFPQPQHEDVWHFLNGGVDLLVGGRNPYLGVPIVEAGVHKVLTYTYPPGALLLLAPFRLFAGDIRWAYLACEIVVLAAWWWILRQDGMWERWREALVLVPLALPRASQAFFIFSNHDWVLLALALLALVAASRSRRAASVVLLGIAIASKQYFILFPLTFLLPAVRPRTVLYAVGLAAAISLPFFVWGPSRFLVSVFGNLSLPPDTDRLTLYATLSHLGLVLPRAAQAGLSVLALGATLRLAYMTRERLPKALVACGLALALFTFCSPFAAYNYYVYALVFVTWGFALAGLPSFGRGSDAVFGATPVDPPHEG